VSEDLQLPTYQAALARVRMDLGDSVLDVGCGAGAFLRLVAERGGEPYGLDASESLVEFARAGLPRADIRVGEMEALPWEDDFFDLVTGFNAFFFANDMVAALREAGRVAKSGAHVLIQVWGAHENCDLEAMKQIARPYLPPRPPDAPPDPDFSQPGALEALATRAGLSCEASSTSPGRSSTRTKTRSDERWWRSRAWRASWARSASPSSGRRSSMASRRTASPTAATGSRTSTAI